MSGILVLCLTITLFLPLVTYLALGSVEDHLYARGQATPILVGSKGSPFLLTFNSIYFRTEIKEKLRYGSYEKLRDSLEGQVIPLHTFHTAKGIPVVGTSFDYFTFRGLKPREGTLPQRLGDAVLGSEAAKKLRAAEGGSVITDSASIYDISAEYPLKMRVVGVLASTGTPDDQVIFVDVKTAWVIDGIGHGHEDMAGTVQEAQEIDLTNPDQNPDDAVIFIEASEIVYNSRLKKYNEITPENIHTFHFHGDDDEFPLSALIVLPATYREEVVALLSEINLTEGLQAVRPTEQVREILEILLNLKKVFDSFSGLVFLSTAAFMVLVIALQIRQRKGERLILYRIGGGRYTVQALLGLEVLILLILSAALALAASFTVLAALRSYLQG